MIIEKINNVIELKYLDVSSNLFNLGNVYNNFNNRTVSYFNVNPDKIMNDLVVDDADISGEYTIKLYFQVKQQPGLYDCLEISTNKKEIIEYCLFRLANNEDILLKDIEENFTELLL